MLCVIAFSAYFIQNVASTEAIGVIRNNHQVRPAVTKPRADDTVNGTHLILKFMPCI
jgi:hypothetical protein